ncbi:MAG TPA: hypothetical protein VF607_03470, partial [Verrucomicrobiae bacterium]
QRPNGRNKWISKNLTIAHKSEATDFHAKDGKEKPTGAPSYPRRWTFPTAWRAAGGPIKRSQATLVLGMRMKS